MRCFHLEEEPAPVRGSWRPPPELARHLRALRLRPDEEVLLLPPVGPALRARPAPGGALDLLGPAPRPRLSLLPVTLVTAWPKGPRADDLLVRAAETGVTRIQPVAWARSVAGRASPPPTRLARWRRILRESCQQCRRPDLPELAPQVLEPEAAVSRARGLLLALHPGAPPLLEVLDEVRPAEVTCFVGPEGGMTAAERDLLAAAGARPAGLGPTVLRIEAAAGAVGILVQHWHLLHRARQSQPRSMKET